MVMYQAMELYRIGEAAKAMGITRQWLRELVNRGKVTTINVGGVSFIPISEVERYNKADGKIIR